MHDYNSAAWADHHGSLTASIDTLIGTLIAAFDRLQRIQFDAPWRRAGGRPASQ